AKYVIARSCDERYLATEAGGCDRLVGPFPSSKHKKSTSEDSLTRTGKDRAFDDHVGVGAAADEDRRAGCANGEGHSTKDRQFLGKARRGEASAEIIRDRGGGRSAEGESLASAM